MRVHEVGAPELAHRPPSAKTRVLPDAIDDHHVVFGGVREEPGNQVRRIGIPSLARPDRVHRERKFSYPGISRVVAGKHFDFVPKARPGSSHLTSTLARPTI